MFLDFVAFWADKFKDWKFIISLILRMIFSYSKRAQILGVCQIWSLKPKESMQNQFLFSITREDNVRTTGLAKEIVYFEIAALFTYLYSEGKRAAISK